MPKVRVRRLDQRLPIAGVDVVLNVVSKRQSRRFRIRLFPLRGQSNCFTSLAEAGVGVDRVVGNGSFVEDSAAGVLPTEERPACPRKCRELDRTTIGRVDGSRLEIGFRRRRKRNRVGVRRPVRCEGDVIVDGS